MEITQIHGVNAENLIGQIKEIVKNAIPQPQTETTKDKFLTRNQVKELLQISLVTIHNWTKKGILNPYRIGNKLRFKESEVLDALQSVNGKKQV